MWAGNIAAHRRGQRSLEYRYVSMISAVRKAVHNGDRLRDALDLKINVHSLLNSLSGTINSCEPTATGQRRFTDCCS
jgi:hypothetical protein